MNSTMTDLALAGNCGGRAARGFAEAARTRSSASIAPKAMEPKPQKASARNSLRLQVGLECALIRLIHIQKVVNQKHGQTKFAWRILLQKLQRDPALNRCRRTPQRKLIGAIDLAGCRGSGIGS